MPYACHLRVRLLHFHISVGFQLLHAWQLTNRKHTPQLPPRKFVPLQSSSSRPHLAEKQGGKCDTCKTHPCSTHDYTMRTSTHDYKWPTF